MSVVQIAPAFEEMLIRQIQSGAMPMTHSSQLPTIRATPWMVEAERHVNNQIAFRHLICVIGFTEMHSYG